MLQLALRPYQLRFKQPAPTSRGLLTHRDILFITAWDTQTPDVVGWGECGPVPGLSLDDQPDFAAACAQACAAFNAATYDQTPADWPPTFASLPSLLFGLETALRDLQQGGRRLLWDTPFSRGETTLPTHGLIWMDTPEGLLRQIEHKLAHCFRVIKLKVGALPFAQELALLRTVRTTYPAAAVELRLDANGAFPPDEAMDRLEQLAPFEIAFLEQPVPAGHWDVLRALCRQSPIPLALDEELIGAATPARRRHLLDRIAPQHLILKPALLGGFAAAEDWMRAAQERGIQWWVNSLLESNLGLNAICQWTSEVGGQRVHGLGTGGLFTNNIPSPLRLTGAALHLEPGAHWELPKN